MNDDKAGQLQADIGELNHYIFPLLVSFHHDFRNQVDQVLSELEYLRRLDNRLINEKRQKLLSDMQDQITLMSTNFDRLMRFLRPIPWIGDRSRRINIHEILKRAVDLKRASAARNHVRIELICERNISTYGVFDNLLLAVCNVLDNAVDAYEGINRERKEIVLQASCDDVAIQIRIIDHGQGIPKDQLQEVFKLGFTTKRENMGLGLAIARRLLRSCGGDIHVESTWGVMTEVILTIPLKDESSASMIKGEVQSGT